MAVRDAADRSRYEFERDGEVVGFVDYRLDGDVVEMTHAEVYVRRNPDVQDLVAA